MFFVACVVLSPVVALVLLEIASDNRPRVGDLVETVSRVDLEDGTVVERKFRAEVLAMKVIDQVAVVQINGRRRTQVLNRLLPAVRTRNNPSSR